MKYTRILLVTLPLMVTGCLDVFDKDDRSVYTPPTPSVPKTPAITAPDVKPLSSAQGGCGCPDATPVPTSSSPSSLPLVPQQPPVVEEGAADDWQPLDGHLIQAGEQVMALKKSKGGAYPSHQEMATHLQITMGLTASQAEKVLEELGF